MSKKQIIGIIIAIALIIFAIFVIRAKSGQGPGITMEQRSLFEASFAPTAKSEEVLAYMQKAVSLAVDTEEISIGKDCRPDIPVAMLRSYKKMSYLNSSQTPYELNFGNKTYTIQPGGRIRIGQTDLFSTSTLPKGMVLRTYGCKGITSRAGFLVITAD